VVQNINHLFTWDQIPGKDNQKPITFLKDTLNINWAEHAKLSKSKDGNKICITNENQSIEIIRDYKEKAVIKFRDDRVYQLQIKEENGTVQIYNKEISPVLESSGNSPVGTIAIIFFVGYFIFISFFLFFGLIFLLSAQEVSDTKVTLSFLTWEYSMFQETRLLLIVALAGALGSLVHALRSFYKYVGNRQLVWSWLSMYLLLPFVGANLGLVFYLVIRAGFFSPDATVEQTSPFGFAALSTLVGLFSEQAVCKLKKVAETIFTKPDKGKDHLNSKQENTSESNNR